MTKLKEILGKIRCPTCECSLDWEHDPIDDLTIDTALSAIKKELEACVPEKRYIHPLANTASTEVQKGLAENKIITETLTRIKGL